MTAYPTQATHPATEYPHLWDALRDVTDPEIPVSVVDMGLIVGITQAAGVVAVRLTFTQMGCFAAEFIIEDITARLLREPDVREVQVEVVWHPVWTKARLSDEAYETMREWGISA